MEIETLLNNIQRVASEVEEAGYPDTARKIYDASDYLEFEEPRDES